MMVTVATLAREKEREREKETAREEGRKEKGENL